MKNGVKTEMGPILAARGVTVVFAGKTVLDDIDFDIAPRENCAIVGGIHSGKTVFLRLLAGLQKPTAGVVTFQGIPVRTYDPLGVPWGQGIGYVSQDFGLRSNLTAVENVSLPLLYKGENTREDAQEASTVILHRLGVNDIYARPAELTPGEMALVSLGRALVARPQVLLFDNPIVMINVDQARQVVKLLDELRRETDLAVVSACSSEAVASLLSERSERLLDGRLEEIP